MSKRQVKINGDLWCPGYFPDSCDEVSASELKFFLYEGEIRRVDNLSDLIDDYDTSQFRSFSKKVEGGRE
ncbi:hypothetical protein MHI57_24635 [Cytobacillus sp. FSL K6-0129]|uniref:hypothetical protein n=1 Tax=Cytobacillus sp. FSL K6-0129 TaxID=2921421 RepID=UPI0030F5CB05